MCGSERHSWANKVDYTFEYLYLESEWERERIGRICGSRSQFANEEG